MKFFLVRKQKKKMKTIVGLLFLVIQLGCIASQLQFADDTLDLEAIYKQALFDLDNRQAPQQQDQEQQHPQQEFVIYNDSFYPVDQMNSNLRNSDDLGELLRSLVPENSMNLNDQLQQNHNTLLASEYPYDVYKEPAVLDTNTNYYGVKDSDLAPQVEVYEGQVDPSEAQASTDMDEILKLIENYFYGAQNKLKSNETVQTNTTTAKPFISNFLKANIYLRVVLIQYLIHNTKVHNLL